MGRFDSKKNIFKDFISYNGFFFSESNGNLIKCTLLGKTNGGREKFVQNIFARTFQKEVRMCLAETEKLLVLSTPSIDIDVAKRRAQGQRRLDMRTRCGFSQRNIPEK